MHTLTYTYGLDTTVDMTYSSSALLTVAISNFNASLFPGIWVFYYELYRDMKLSIYPQTWENSYSKLLYGGDGGIRNPDTCVTGTGDNHFTTPPEKDATYTESPTANYRMNTEPFISGYSSPRWMPTHIQWQEKEINYIYATFG